MALTWMLLETSSVLWSSSTYIVADSRYKLYDDFVNPEGRRLGEYLGAVREAFVAGLEKGGSDPFRTITAGYQ